MQAHVRDLAAELRRRGHEVSVLAPAEDEDLLPDYVTSAGRPLAVPYNGSVARVNFGMVSAARVRKWIKAGHFDVLHVHEATSPTASVLACWIANGPIVATQHTAMERSRALASLSLLVNTALEKVSGRIAVSEKARQFMVEHVGGDAVLIPNGVDCSAFADPEPLPGYPRPEGPTLFFIGRIDEAPQGLADPAGCAAGDHRRDSGGATAGRRTGEVEEVAQSLAPELAERVEFLGLVSERDKVRAFHSAELYVAPQLGVSFGIVLLEAMASGTPVLASDLEAFRLVLGEGAYGQLFPTGDPAALAAAAVRLLREPRRRAELSRAACVRAAEYDWSERRPGRRAGLPVGGDAGPSRDGGPQRAVTGRWVRRADLSDAGRTTPSKGRLDVVVVGAAAGRRAGGPGLVLVHDRRPVGPGCIGGSR